LKLILFADTVITLKIDPKINNLNMAGQIYLALKERVFHAGQNLPCMKLLGLNPVSERRALPRMVYSSPDHNDEPLIIKGR
jgi:hypothetical protein